MGRFDGKVALVTGANRGIGQATAVRLATEGAVVAVNHRPTGNPDETLKQIETAGGKAFPVVADMRDPDMVKAMVKDVSRLGGRLDYLVSNAAINPLKKWTDITLEDYNQIQEINLRGTWVVVTESAKQMIAEGHGGAIVCVSSISAWVGAKEQTVYCATKAGIWMMVKSLATVFGEHNIRINCLLPGAILTDMSKELLDPASPARKYYEERTPLGRIAAPSECAGPIAFLLSDDASYITSSELLVDGGFITNAE
ncbi:MAG: SDR family oxidoreductase [Leptolinea sp.]|jgi:NAD(P)-dependent dehydrogenase (short-subunit alcohol dehydrogenase family)|nr:SDR family oxidoreductase [Leptolinea sp.]